MIAKKSSESKSKQLTEALLTGTPIIVVTIQTFPYALEAILTNQSLAQSNFAVIIDEAHTSQTGSTAKGLRAALTLNLSPQELEQMSIEDILTKVQEARHAQERFALCFYGNTQAQHQDVVWPPERP
ncbi:hypothetical protein ABR759_04570 [Escherichia coli]